MEVSWGSTKMLDSSYLELILQQPRDQVKSRKIEMPPFLLK